MSDKIIEEEKKLVKRDGEPVIGQAFGEIDVSTIMVDKNGVQAMIDASITTVYKPGGSKTAAQITSDLLRAENEGRVYNASEEFTTTADFVEGAGIKYEAGTNFVIINTAAEGETAVYKFDVLGGMDKSVVRGITLDNDEYIGTLTPVNGIVNIPLAGLSSDVPLPGVVVLDDSIEHELDDASAGFAATPKAVADALLSAKNFTTSSVSSYFNAHEHEYGLNNVLSSDNQVLVFTTTVNGTTTSSNIELSGATDTAFGLVKLTDDYTAHGVLSTKIATTPGAVLQAYNDAVTSAATHTGEAISTAINALSVAQVSVQPSETLSTFVEENGIVTVTKQAIAIAESQVTDLYTGLANALSATTFSTQPTTVNQTITLLMNLINALKGLAPASNTPEEP